MDAEQTQTMDTPYEPSDVVLEDIMIRFKHHPPRPDQPQRYESIRGMGAAMASALCHACPPSRELSLALTKLEEAVFWANAAIARNEQG